MPLFNPDQEAHLPASVGRLHHCVAKADGLLIVSPEYAHGVSSTIKNALDWLVGFEPFAGKLVAVINTSPQTHHAGAAMREILQTMAAVIVEPASITLALAGAGLDEPKLMASASVATSLQAVFAALQAAKRIERAF